MAEDKPFGWRPYTEERRQELRDSGFDDEVIDQLEANNIYQPIDTAILGFHLSAAIIDAATKHLGPDFIHDVRSSLEKNAAQGAMSEEVELQVEAKILRDFLADTNWDRIISRVSAGES